MYRRDGVGGGVLGQCSGGRGAVGGHGGMSAAHGINEQPHDELGGRDEVRPHGGQPGMAEAARSSRAVMGRTHMAGTGPIWAVPTISVRHFRL